MREDALEMNVKNPYYVRIVFNWAFGTFDFGRISSLFGPGIRCRCIGSIIPGVVSEALSKIAGMELEITEILLSVGGRSDVDGVAAIWPSEGPESGPLPGMNLKVCRARQRAVS